MVLPTVPHLVARVREAVAGWAVAPRIVVEPAEKWAAFRSARAALAASGSTVMLELALSGVPTVAAYRLHLIEAIIARMIRIQSRLQSVILANLVLGENAVPELLQEECTPEALVEALVPLSSDSPDRERVKSRPSPGLTRSWTLAARRQAPRLRLSSLKSPVQRLRICRRAVPAGPPGHAGLVHMEEAIWPASVNDAAGPALPMEQPSC